MFSGGRAAIGIRSLPTLDCSTEYSLLETNGLAPSEDDASKIRICARSIRGDEWLIAGATIYWYLGPAFGANTAATEWVNCRPLLFRNLLSSAPTVLFEPEI